MEESERFGSCPENCPLELWAAIRAAVQNPAQFIRENPEVINESPSGNSAAPGLIHPPQSAWNRLISLADQVAGLHSAGNRTSAIQTQADLLALAEAVKADHE